MIVIWSQVLFYLSGKWNNVKVSIFAGFCLMTSNLSFWEAPRLWSTTSSHGWKSWARNVETWDYMWLQGWGRYWADRPHGRLGEEVSRICCHEDWQVLLHIREVQWVAGRWWLFQPAQCLGKTQQQWSWLQRGPTHRASIQEPGSSVHTWLRLRTWRAQPSPAPSLTDSRPQRSYFIFRNSNFYDVHKKQDTAYLVESLWC